MKVPPAGAAGGAPGTVKYVWQQLAVPLALPLVPNMVPPSKGHCKVMHT